MKGILIGENNRIIEIEEKLIEKREDNFLKDNESNNSLVELALRLEKDFLSTFFFSLHPFDHFVFHAVPKPARNWRTFNIQRSNSLLILPTIPFNRPRLFLPSIFLSFSPSGSAFYATRGRRKFCPSPSLFSLFQPPRYSSFSAF